ncbi:MAG: ArnT family glycosyltransferase [Candidatus Levyibacteriota bacterium]
MPEIIAFIKKHSYETAFLSVILIGLFFRSYNFINRIDYGSDTTRDILIAQEAVRTHQLPLFASFSSTGPYVFGPHYYWLNMISYVIFPTYIAPFILLLVFGTITIGIMMHAAKIIGGSRLSIVTGLLIAFSPQFIARSTFLTQHGYLGFASVFSFLFFILLIKTVKIRYAFILGITIGVATMFHYAGINLLLLAPFIFFIPKMSIKLKLLSLILFSTGFAFMWIPLLYWDSSQSFANLRNFADFILIGQYRMYVPNSWRIFLFSFLPDYWQVVVGGYRTISSFLIILVFLLAPFAAFKKNLNKYLVLSFFSFLSLLILNRYYRGERFDGYVIFLAPFIFILSAWALLTLIEFFISIKKQYPFIFEVQFLGHALLIIVILGSFWNATQFIFTQNPRTNGDKNARDLLLEKYPGKTFAIYDYLYRTTDQSFALVFFLHERHADNPKGYPIGVMDRNYASLQKNRIIGDINGALLLDLQGADLNQSTWKRKNQEDVYQESIGWAKHEKLTSTFSFLNFIKEKLKMN